MSCILCNQIDLQVISTRDAKNSSFLKVSFCKACGMVQQEPIPTDENVNEYYSLEYREEYKNTYIPKLKHVFRAGNLAIQRIHFLKKSSVVQGRLLDIGAGGGEFTYLSGRAGFESEGIEPNIGYSNYARDEYDVDIKTGQLNDVVGKFQVITMFHVLEHIPNPVKTFKRLWELLEDKGFVFIEVPNIETNDASPHNIYFKAHIHYFSEATLISAASTYFDVITVDNSSNIQIIFRKKDIKGSLILPVPTKVNYTHERLQKKGWLEYIFKGKGYLKVFYRVKTIVKEVSLRQQSGLNLLQKINESGLD